MFVSTMHITELLQFHTSPEHPDVATSDGFEVDHTDRSYFLLFVALMAGIRLAGTTEPASRALLIGPIPATSIRQF